jgi:hypothetical protein
MVSCAVFQDQYNAKEEPGNVQVDSEADGDRDECRKPNLHADLAIRAPSVAKPIFRKERILNVTSMNPRFHVRTLLSQYPISPWDVRLGTGPGLTNKTVPQRYIWCIKGGGYAVRPLVNSPVNFLVTALCNGIPGAHGEHAFMRPTRLTSDSSYRVSLHWRQLLCPAQVKVVSIASVSMVPWETALASSQYSAPLLELRPYVVQGPNQPRLADASARSHQRTRPHGASTCPMVFAVRNSHITLDRTIPQWERCR